MTLWRITGVSSATLMVVASAVWGGFALWFQAPGGSPARAVSLLLWALFCTAMTIGLWYERTALSLSLYAVAFAVLLAWWHRVPASNYRQWADDVSRITTGSVEGDRAILRNVRNFDWRTTTDYTERWETREYDLSRIRSVDMIMSYWTVPAIAHMLISFGFADGKQVAFSVEIRREKTEAFSEIGGFFKQFELSIIAADERDVVRLRTNVRGEDGYLYHLRMPLKAMRSLFLGYLGEANELDKTPRFYNTVTVNCTTLVYQMMKRIVGHLPLDYRLLFSGYLPEYVYAVRGLDQRLPLAELRAKGRITERAKAADRDGAFSAAIRQGIPVLEPQDLPLESQSGSG